MTYRQADSLANLPYLEKNYKKRKPTPLVSDGIYIMDISKVDTPELLNNKFNKKEDARRAIRLELEGKFSIYKIILGEIAIKHRLLFKKEPRYHGLRDRTHVRNYKYDYPKAILNDLRAKTRFRNAIKYKRKKLKPVKNEHNNI